VFICKCKCTEVFFLSHITTVFDVTVLKIIISFIVLSADHHYGEMNLYYWCYVSQCELCCSVDLAV